MISAFQHSTQFTAKQQVIIICIAITIFNEKVFFSLLRNKKEDCFLIIVQDVASELGIIALTS